MQPTRAHAVALDWLNAAGGFAGVAANWNPAQVPTAADNLRFNLAGGYNVTFGVNAPVSAGIVGIDGSPGLFFNVPHSTNNLNVGTVAGLLPVLHVAGGSLTVAQNSRIATGAGITGVLEITGSTTDVTLTSGAGQLEVGGAGTGWLSVVNGGLLEVLGGVHVPQIGGGIGSLLVQGSGSTRRSTMNIDANVPLYYMHVGSSGTGSVQVQDGGLLSVQRDVRIGETAGATGSMSLLNGDPIDSARVSISGDLWIARNDVVGAAGTGSVSVGNESAMDVLGVTWTYDDQAGGLGTLTVEEGGRFATHGLHVGTPASELLLHGGRLQITGGVLDLTGDPLRINSATGTPTVELLAGSTCSLNSSTVPALEVGGAAVGRLNVLGGSSLTVHDKLVWLGTLAGGNGALHVGTGSTLVTDQDMIVGRAGSGLLFIDGGSHCTVAGLNLSSLATGTGQLWLYDAGTEAHVAGHFVLSGLLAGSSGSESICNVWSGAKLWLDDATGSCRVWPEGDLNVWAGEVHIARQLDHMGALSLQGGIITGGSLDLTGGGSIAGFGDIASAVRDTVDSLAVITAAAVSVSYQLLLGDASAARGYDMRGKLDVSDLDVTLRSLDTAIVGTVLMAGGTLRGPAGGTSIESGRYLKGSGTVQGPVLNSAGSIFADGAGLSFGGMLNGTGLATQGTLFHFLTGGGFQGGGLIRSSVISDAGAVLTATGALTLGAAPAATTLTLNGKLDIGAQVVTLAGTAPADVGGEIALDAGTLTYAGGTAHLLAPGGLLSGKGAVNATVLTSGLVAPGTTLPSLSAGTLTISTLQMEPAGKVRIKLGSHALVESDFLNVAGTATLGGRLDFQLLPSYSAAWGDSFLVMVCGSRVGRFDNVSLLDLPATGKLAVHYNGNQVWVVILPGLVDVPDAPIATIHDLRFAATASPARSAVFAIELPDASVVRIEAFDVGGRRLATLNDGPLSAGRHRFELPRGPRSVGMVFARANVVSASAQRVLTARAVVVK